MKRISVQYHQSMRCYLLVTLIALELLMSFSFLGYIHIEPISITVAYIPVLLAGALVGVPEAVAVGTVFGLSSMWKASASYVMASDQLFSPVTSGYPLESILLSVGSRMLFGLLIGVLYFAARRVRFTWLWTCIISFFGKFLHSFLVFGFMGLLFPETGYHAGDALQGFASFSDFAANLVITGIVMLFWYAEKSRTWQEFRRRVEKAQHLHLGEHYHGLSIAIVIVLAACFAMAVAIYFVNRMDYVLSQSGVALTDTNYANLMHLQIQFLIGILSIMALVTMFLVFNRKYATYMNYEAKKDALTGLLTRKSFFQACRDALDRQQPDRGVKGLSGCFMMIDIDHFKEINDRYGHPEGDRMLKSTAQLLQEIFGEYGVIGRVGGDEFALLWPMPVSRQSLEEKLSLLLNRMREAGKDGSAMSCSIGVTPIAELKTVEELYKEADHLLYTAKQQGRGQYRISPVEV